MHRTFWVSTTLSTFIMLVAWEILLIEFLATRTTPNNIALVILSFDVFWWFAVAFVINLATNHFLWTPLEKKTNQVIPLIIRRFLTYAIFILAVFGIIAFVFDQRLTSLLATSGMIAMIIGLAVQANISNIFSGIAINIERPFYIGDWVKIGDIEAGRVEDITWRTTKLWNRDGSIVRIPNANVAESNIQNFSGPDFASSTWIFIDVDPKHSPVLVETILHKSLLSVPEVLTSPPPFASFRGVEEWSANYMLGFNIKDYGQLLPIRKKVAKKIWADLRLAGIEFAIKRWNVIESAASAITDHPFAAKRVLQDIGLFKNLTKETTLSVEDSSIVRTFASGETISKHGDSCSSIFVIIEGVCTVDAILSGGESIEIKRLGAGEYLAEEAILNSGKRSAELTTLTDTRIIEIRAEDLINIFSQDEKTAKVWTKILKDNSKEISEKTSLQQQKQSDLATKQSSGIFRVLKKLFS
jgi:potassium-dependent mechanosensitive channel